VSIIIPTYNRANLIGETIRSVLNQTYTNWELLIIDDGSQDNTNEVVSAFSDNRISYFLIKHCGIFGKVRNEGIKISKGDYIAFLDSDDLWSPDKLQIQLDLLHQHREAFFIFNNVTIFGTRAYASPPDYDTLFVGSILLSMLEETRFVFYPSSLMFKREPVINKLGLVDDVLLYGTDTKYFLNMCQFFTGIFTNKRLVQIRRHEHSTTENYYTSDVFVDSINIASAIYRARSITRTQYKRILGHYYYKMGMAELINLKKPRAALTSFASCIRFVPFRWKGYVRLLQSFLLLAVRRHNSY
jgi:glycosyltransferase involved in cell wall biosynthesis